MIHLLALLLLHARGIHAHIWSMCPEPRQCQLFQDNDFAYQTDDGPIRQDPCSYEPLASKPSTVLVAGDTYCHRFWEYVSHPGYIRIALSLVPEGRTSDPTSFDNIVLVERHEMVGGEPARRGIEVTLPANVTCEHCTIQLKQWAEDLQWWYYDCVSVKIVSPSAANLPGSSMCTARVEAGTCSEEIPGGSMSAKVYSTVFIGMAIVVPSLYLFGAWIVLCCKRPRRQYESEYLAFCLPPVPKGNKMCWGAFVVLVVVAIIVAIVPVNNALSCSAGLGTPTSADAGDL